MDRYSTRGLRRKGLTDRYFPHRSRRSRRIDLFDEEIENLRLFDPHTQLSTKEVRSIRILPAREFPFDDTAIRGFRERFRDHLPGRTGTLSRLPRHLRGAATAGIEYYLPLFFDSTASLLDYFSPNTLVVLTEGALAGLESGWSLIQERYGNSVVTSSAHPPSRDGILDTAKPSSRNQTVSKTELTSHELEVVDERASTRKQLIR
ncbi:MAG: hypothetical protein CM1200mP36_00850 [Gammaproteobacteria bacterium]|nr:MAG: hypothetical protein CM1200mP36_00850 [Gammaproteobacteria bacterium]